jgi:hypothetical protein
MLLKEKREAMNLDEIKNKKEEINKRGAITTPQACYNKACVGLREACGPWAIIFFRSLFLKKEFHSQSIAALNISSGLTKDQRNISNCFIVYMNN